MLVVKTNTYYGIKVYGPYVPQGVEHAEVWKQEDKQF